MHYTGESSKKIKIGDKYIGYGYPTYIIAEVGSNHDGNLDNAKGYILKAKEIGADAIKFQAFTAENLVNKNKLPDIFALMKSLEMPLNWLPELINFSNDLGIEFLCTPFDHNTVDLLLELGIKAFKISSGDLTNIPLIKYVAEKSLPVILSTGMSYMKDVDEAVHTINAKGNDDIAILHCVSKYPPKYEEMNLKNINTLKTAYQYPVGFSDHSEEHIGVIAAVTMGAKIIEKHITFDKTLSGADHPFALTVPEFKDMIEHVRKLELALGSSVKMPSHEEVQGPLNRARRSIYASQDINKGTVITKEMLTIIRPVRGLEPKFFDLVVGRQAKTDIKYLDEITWEKI
ncbi:N-acetylneuraminate synthase family protein [Alkaliphilus peptidifermentans]|uniref:N-acetylneuraminate synthase n=1 Tax=Alkaliphilus peptidifermentans DSM 18978 TaxID=1120976 RepID=A0A1G5JE45_9FIRM|nr:N-acetylneuraminate synthase family protein [Alkaliphilus peptidifermentans]SCY86653.1 N-acetylneuraminate synthase [Alkaliphilus peptidifermentans DSM 18978]